jgi:DNA primase
MQGFGARALQPDQKPKYVNSPEGALYSKRRTLYGIERARPSIVKSGRALVVEGYTDVIACHQAQITDAVAVMGTAITPEQVKLLGAYAEEAVLALDADRAGREAMLRAEMVGGKRLRLRVARMPEGQDPADLLAGGDGASATAFRKAIEEAVDLPVFHARTLLDDGDLTSPSGRDRALDEVVEVIAAMADSITREELMREVGERLDADPGLVARRIAAAGRGVAGGGRRGDQQAAVPAAPDHGSRPPAGADYGADPGPETAQAAVAPRVLSAREGRELGLLGMCVRLSAEGSEVLERLTDEHFSSPTAAKARLWLRDHLEEPLTGLPREDEDLVAYVTEVVMRSEREPASPHAIELSELELELARVNDQLSAVAANGGDPPVELQRERAKLTERIARATS